MTHWKKSIPTRLPMTVAVLLAVAALTAILLGGCENKPDDPVFENPFDPYSSELGNALNVIASVDADSILVVWTQRQGFDISYYELAVSETYGSGYEFLEAIPHTAAVGGLYKYKTPEPTTTYYFRVAALRDDGTTANTSYMPPAMLIMPPSLKLGDGSGTTPTRFIAMEITVAQGDTLLVADNEDLTDAVTLPAAEPGVAQTHVWDVGEVEENGGKFYFYVQAVADSYTSVVRADSVTVEFAPAFEVGDGSATTAARFVTLNVPAVGVEQMRFASSEEDLASAAWIPGASEVPNYELVDTLNRQTVYGEFESDFGFTSEVIEFNITGDALAEPDFEIGLRREITNDPVLVLLCDAVATHVRFGESPDFETALWREYADTLDFELSGGSGTKTVYGQFRNDFIDSELMTAVVEYIEQPLAVDFLKPLDAQTMTQGTQYLIEGWAGAASPAEVDSVKVELGDGAGFVPVAGIEDWNLPWQLPELGEADADSLLLTLRARAWSEADSLTAQITVKIRK